MKCGIAGNTTTIQRDLITTPAECGWLLRCFPFLVPLFATIFQFRSSITSLIRYLSTGFIHPQLRGRAAFRYWHSSELLPPQVWESRGSRSGLDEERPLLLAPKNAG